MLIYLLRHGQTEYNAQKRYQGQRDIPLSPEGAAQLRRADFDPAVVYVSTLQRTSQTARILFPEAKLVPVDGLKEMCFGSFARQPFQCLAVGGICRQLLHIGQRLAGKHLRKGALAAVERPGDKDHNSPPHWQAHSAASIHSSTARRMVLFIPVPSFHTARIVRYIPFQWYHTTSPPLLVVPVF